MSNHNPPVNGFKKGDPRINRKGRPKSFDALRELSLEIAHEKVKRTDGTAVEINGHAVSVAEGILRQWAASKDPRRQQAFIEIAYGKVPDDVRISGDFQLEIVEQIVDGNSARNDPTA